MVKNSFFLDAIIVESGIILKQLLKPRNVGNVIIHLHSEIQLNSLKFVQFKMLFQL